MDSRKAFESWLKEISEPEEVDYAKTEDRLMFLAWQAGRASMRDEAAEMAANQWLKDPMVSACDSIRDIQP